MEKIKLSTFLTLEGIGAASGIVFHDNRLFIISDNSGYLFDYSLESNQLNKHLLIANTSVTIEKKSKPDFEAITLKGSELHIFGSGSTINRNKKILFDTLTNQSSEIDFSKFYNQLKTTFSISDDDLNIEGALFMDEYLLLFQRGNGLTAKNGVFKIKMLDEENIAELAFYPIALPKIRHVETSFTDAIRVDDKIYFLAAAEDTISTYEDGEVLGTVLGVMNSTSFEIENFIQLSPTHKLEGLTLFKKNQNELTFLLCEDNDTEDLIATIYELAARLGPQCSHSTDRQKINFDKL